MFTIFPRNKNSINTIPQNVGFTKQKLKIQRIKYMSKESMRMTSHQRDYQKRDGYDLKNQTDSRVKKYKSFDF